MREFVSTEQARFRDEKKAEREAVREKEERRLKEARERDERAHVFALEELRLKAAVEEARARGAGDNVTVVESSVDRLRLPTYQEGEDITGFLTRFGRVAQLLQIHENTLAVRLRSQLTGKVSELYIHYLLT